MGGSFILSARSLVRAGAPGSDRTGEAPVVRFPQGVASADPRSDGVVLWTRAELADPSVVVVPDRVELSRAPDFSEVVATRELVAERSYNWAVCDFVERV